MLDYNDNRAIDITAKSHYHYYQTQLTTQNSSDDPYNPRECEG